MRLSDLLKGVRTVQPFYNEDGYHFGAEHDQVYLYPTDRPLRDEDIAAMREAGWFQPDAADQDVYDPAEGWSAYT